MINDFFHMTIEVLLEYCEQDVKEVVYALCTIGSASQPFYKVSPKDYSHSKILKECKEVSNNNSTSS